MDDSELSFNKLLSNDHESSEMKMSSPLKTYSKKTPQSDKTDRKSRYGRSHKPRLSLDFLSTDKKVSQYLKVDTHNQMHYFKASPYTNQKPASRPVTPGTPRRGRPPKALSLKPADGKYTALNEAMGKVMSVGSSRSMNEYQAPVPTSTETVEIPAQLLIPKEEQLSDSEEVINEGDWNVGDLAWAFVGGYPYWPCAVTKEPGENKYKMYKIQGKARQQKEFLHVRFFGDKGRRSWIMSSHVIPFHGLDSFTSLADETCTPAIKKKDPKLYRSFTIPPTFKKAWQAAVSEAESLREAPRHERVQYFINMFPPSLDPPPVVEVKKEPKKRGRKRKTDLIATPPPTIEKKIKLEPEDPSYNIPLNSDFQSTSDYNPNIKIKTEPISSIKTPATPVKEMFVPRSPRSAPQIKSEPLSPVKSPFPAGPASAKVPGKKRGRPPGRRKKSDDFDFTPMKRKYVKKSSVDLRLKENRQKRKSVDAKNPAKRAQELNKKFRDPAYEMFYEKNFDSLSADNPELSQEDIEKFIDKMWADVKTQKPFEYRSRENAEVLSADSGNDSKSETNSTRSNSPPPIMLPSSKTPYKRGISLFSGVKTEKVCQVCFKNGGGELGEILKCRGPCGQPFHAECADKPRYQPILTQAKKGPEEVVKKKRGRPRSVGSTPSKEPPTNSTEVESQLECKLTSPMKPVLPPRTSAATPDTHLVSPTETPVKRGRGRPRKYPPTTPSQNLTKDNRVNVTRQSLPNLDSSYSSVLKPKVELDDDLKDFRGFGDIPKEQFERFELIRLAVSKAVKENACSSHSSKVESENQESSRQCDLVESDNNNKTDISSSVSNLPTDQCSPDSDLPTDNNIVPLERNNASDDVDNKSIDFSLQLNSSEDSIVLNDFKSKSLTPYEKNLDDTAVGKELNTEDDGAAMSVTLDENRLQNGNNSKDTPITNGSQQSSNGASESEPKEVTLSETNNKDNLKLLSNFRGDSFESESSNNNLVVVDDSSTDDRLMIEEPEEEDNKASDSEVEFTDTKSPVLSISSDDSQGKNDDESMPNETENNIETSVTNKTPRASLDMPDLNFSDSEDNVAIKPSSSQNLVLFNSTEVKDPLVEQQNTLPEMKTNSTSQEKISSDQNNTVSLGESIPNNASSDSIINGKNENALSMEVIEDNSVNENSSSLEVTADNINNENSSSMEVTEDSSNNENASSLEATEDNSNNENASLLEVTEDNSNSENASLLEVTEDNSRDENASSIEVTESNSNNENASSIEVIEGNSNNENASSIVVTEGNSSDENASSIEVTEGNSSDENASSIEVTEGNSNNENASSIEVTEGNSNNENSSSIRVTEGNSNNENTSSIEVIEDKRNNENEELSKAQSSNEQLSDVPKESPPYIDFDEDSNLFPTVKREDKEVRMYPKAARKSLDNIPSEELKKVAIKEEEDNSAKNSDTDSEKAKGSKFLCGLCAEGKLGPCFVCGKEGEELLRCGYCGKVYHKKCAQEWPQAQISETAKGRLLFHCPQHVCHTCVSDNPSSLSARFTNDRLVRCVMCAATYHYGNYCIPAGSEILSTSQLLCPRHYVPQRKSVHHVSASWCMLCALGGDLICCDLCPNSFHLACLHLEAMPEGSFICEDCETGRYPLFGEIVWAKLGTYRWWPARILYPQEIPDNINQLPHSSGEFAVEFFGSHDYYWVNRGRVFLYHEGDGCNKNLGKSRTDELFARGVQEAQDAFIKHNTERANREATSRPSMKPPKYVKIQSNRLVGNVSRYAADPKENCAQTCECDPKQASPCGPDSDCINRLLSVECDPQVCPAGENCQNQNFEKRCYPRLVPFKTESRGWGLKTLDAIAKGSFIIEYVGEMIDEEEYRKRLITMQKNKDENFYFLTIDRDRMLDAGPKGNVARFMNHSCDPNCETQKWTVNGDTRVGLFALENIKPGTELVFNYNLETTGNTKVECKCGASNCSGFIGVKNNTKVNNKNTKVNTTNNVEEKKAAIKKKRRKSKPSKHSEDSCFTCGNGGELLLCDDVSCPKAYHLSCLGLTKHPAGGWVCPWHQCSVCSATKVQRCTLCINSYCEEHSEGNISLNRMHGGYLCFSHNLSDSGSDWSDVNAEESEETSRKSSKKYSKTKIVNGHLG